ncbi:MAG: four helix bundle protein [Bacteroidetes bacterium]|nr:four helix bundle protein [Bacteroidota bacterium]
MAEIKHFEELHYWQKSRVLVQRIYYISKEGELSKDYDLKSQLRRAALSTMNNIAEGFSRFSKKDFIKFLDYTVGSSAEIKSMLYVLEDLNYVHPKIIDELRILTDDTHNLTSGLIRYLRKKKGG